MINMESVVWHARKIDLQISADECNASRVTLEVEKLVNEGLVTFNKLRRY